MRLVDLYIEEHEALVVFSLVVRTGCLHLEMERVERRVVYQVMVIGVEWGREGVRFEII